MTWMVWAGSAGGIALLVRNPWYLLLIAAAAVMIRWRATGQRPSAGMLRLFAGLMLFPTLLNFLFSRAGETVLLEFPVRFIGGPYTLEALLFGAAAGLQLASLLLVMMTFSLLLSPTDLLRRIPAGLAPAGITASIAMNFAPQARRSFDAVREAQQVRGHAPRGFRDLRGIVTPLVILSLESALSVGEGLATRGWGDAAVSEAGRRMAWAGVGLFALGAIAWSLAPTRGWIAAILVGVGATLLLAVLARSGSRSRYRPEVWRRRDSTIVGVTLGVLSLTAILVALAPSLLVYE
ncbi:MAG: energy-coupling factor transporter transmembrane protein EcfT, partial [Anaerolineales bacterium]|nr:energy-coupling factor transporter transmembrane protein EcfT [Anaerolineales bacterium]